MMNKVIIIFLASVLFACNKSASYMPNPPHVPISPLAEEAPENFLPTNRVAPFYPKNAFEKRIQGYAVIEYDILPDGSVVNPKLIKSYPEGYFVYSSLITVQKYKYKKSEHGYKNVKTKINYALAR